MRNFPAELNVKNKGFFRFRYIDRMTCYMRRDIYEHILSKKETEYFDIEKFMRLKYVNIIEDRENIVKTIMSELKSLGWKCKLSFGDTGLFIYSTDKPPATCWDGDL